MSEDTANYTVTNNDDDLTAAYMAGLHAGRADKNWVKITDLEISEAHYKCKTHFLFAREIERILMEKNR
jgi:hypothetical protein